MAEFVTAAAPLGALLDRRSLEAKANVATRALKRGTFRAPFQAQWPPMSGEVLSTRSWPFTLHIT